MKTSAEQKANAIKNSKAEVAKVKLPPTVVDWDRQIQRLKEMLNGPGRR